MNNKAKKLLLITNRKNIKTDWLHFNKILLTVFRCNKLVLSNHFVIAKYMIINVITVSFFWSSWQKQVRKGSNYSSFLDRSIILIELPYFINQEFDVESYLKLNPRIVQQ